MENKAKILVIDDEQGIRDMLSFALGQQGYTIVTASSGKEGVEKVKEESFDMAITDIKMPGMDGITVLGEIKKINPEIEVIVATGYGTMETAIESLRKGAFDYISKPFNIDEVLIVLEKAQRNRQLNETIALYEISKAVFSTIESDELLKIIINSTMKVLKADDASLMLLNEEGKLYIAESCRLDDNIKQETKLAIGERIAGWVAENKESILLINGLKNDVRFKDVQGAGDIRSSLIIPLIGKAKILGILNINRIDIAAYFTQNDLRKANIFASLVSLAIENANLFKKIQSMQLEIMRASRLASIGELASGLAHEIGNPLQTVLGNAELLLMDNEKSEEIKSIKAAALHAKTIISNLLDFSRQKEMIFGKENINALIDKTMLLYGKQLELKKIKVEKKFADLPKITISPSHLEQVFLNIITNAQKAMPHGGTLTITTRLTPHPFPSPLRGEGEVEGKFIEVSFKDTGCGISQENLPKLFEPFFTTDDHGTGLGLSVSYGIVKQHGGDILVNSEGEGKGTEFVVKLPLKFSGGGG